MQFHLRFFQSLRGWCILLSISLLQACATSASKKVISEEPPKPVIPIVYYAEFGEKPALLSEDDIFALTTEQQEDFINYVNQQSNRGVPLHSRVAGYLKQFNKEFNYHSDTYIATESLAKKRGNCLSLAIVTTALARLASVEVGYELMHSEPVYQLKGNTILSSQHIRSILFEPRPKEQDNFFYMLQPAIKIDYFPTGGEHVRRRVTEAEFVSMYFRNKAADAIVNNQLSDAFWLSLEALKYAENNAHATNMLALVYDRLGYDQAAENIYRFGIKNADEKLELLSNYHGYLMRNKRLAEAEEIQRQIAEFDDPNPFNWLDMADSALASGELNAALKYYNKVIELAPYLHHGYSGVGRVEFLKGNTTSARKAFNRAAELALEQDTRAMYQAKLAALTAYTKN